jgi:hypothetical protein
MACLVSFPELRVRGGEGFRQIRWFPENGWTGLEVMLFVWAVVALVAGGLGRTAAASAPCCAP